MSEIFMILNIWIEKSNEKFYIIWTYSQELQILRPNATAQLLSFSEMWRFLVHIKFFEKFIKINKILWFFKFV